ncbi:MerR family transcriptional regulator [Acetobacterium woodii]|uniref:Transcriptional regulator MerR family n=1 Tax=Acetobacterium woodii (strain ATCC 29683 / DSM 1030 / JCM 2381 / KCTC 1655 / WB1) TaxID=931626 RepID=H6LKB2_ACEWD|nr:helix-turn-helix domain-containing protein [Acetobacterium woodii]AFA50032.1 transcriptional regulator MerR family [Acetobacterium woodii DSM 1030]
MYSIGKFSIMLNLNRKTLRFYDEIDLFKPAYVDETNQYRYYEESQIEAIREIIRLKNIGISLEQIKKIRNKMNNASLATVYQERLNEIEVALKQLTKQKELIISEQRQATGERVDENNWVVDKGDFIERGNVYYRDVNCEMEQLNSFLSAFYENAGGKTLHGGHLLKMSLADDTKDICEIFAYIGDHEKDENVRIQEKERCIKVTCNQMSQKGNGYKSLFDYAEKNSLRILNTYEKYNMNDGRMNLEIICSIA